MTQDEHHNHFMVIGSIAHAPEQSSLKINDQITLKVSHQKNSQMFHLSL